MADGVDDFPQRNVSKAWHGHWTCYVGETVADYQIPVYLLKIFWQFSPPSARVYGLSNFAIL